jgi:CxxC motif-containing protein (DUF1111 family)
MLQPLEEAIVAHGGEAEAARQVFRAMSSDEQAHLIQFLKSLRAPKMETKSYMTKR